MLQPLGRRRLFAKIFTAHTYTHTHAHSRSPPDQWSARRTGRYLHNTQQTQETNTHTVCGIRTRDLSNPAAGDARFRRPSHWERFVTEIRQCNLLADSNQRQCHLLGWRSEQHSIEIRPMHSAVLAQVEYGEKENVFTHRISTWLILAPIRPSTPPTPRPNHKPRRLWSYSRYIIV
jgi:hypothetical protein